MLRETGATASWKLQMADSRFQVAKERKYDSGRCQQAAKVFQSEIANLQSSKNLSRSNRIRIADIEVCIGSRAASPSSSDGIAPDQPLLLPPHVRAQHSSCAPFVFPGCLDDLLFVLRERRVRCPRRSAGGRRIMPLGHSSPAPSRSRSRQ